MIQEYACFFVDIKNKKVTELVTDQDIKEIKDKVLHKSLKQIEREIKGNITTDLDKEVDNMIQSLQKSNIEDFK